MAETDGGGPALPSLRRDLRLTPLEHEGKPAFLLQDPEGITEQAVALSPGGMAAAALLDGRRTVSDLQSLLARETGSQLEASELERLVGRLDEAGLLETPELQARRRRVLEEFLASPVRRTALKGAFPAETLELASYLGKFFRDPKGPGKPLPDAPSAAAPPLGLISPHIDLERGGPAYAWSYRALAETPPPDLIVALGVAHASPDSPWVMTRKAYETPYGAMEVDPGLYEQIQGALWYDARADEWAHRREHSLEFQALWLKFLWREKTPPWVPILTSAFERFCTDKPPSTVPAVEEAIRTIGVLLAERAKTRRILILAGVDLAHVGPRFGDDLEPGPEVARRIEDEDRKSLEHALRLEADRFYLSVTAGENWRKVCGLSALYTALRWIKALGGGAVEAGGRASRPTSGNVSEGGGSGVEGRLLTYGQAPDPAGGIVSFAGGVFRRPA